MFTKRLALTAVLFAVAAPVASARPVVDVPVSAPAPAPAAGYATMAAHHDTVSNTAWQRARAVRSTPLVDDTDHGNFPTPVFLLAVLVPLGLVLLQVAGKSVLLRRRERLA